LATPVARTTSFTSTAEPVRSRPLSLVMRLGVLGAAAALAASGVAAAPRSQAPASVPVTGAGAAAAVVQAASASRSQSDNVEFVTQLPEAGMAIAINFIGDTMFVSTATGLLSYDVSDPAAPALLGALPMYIWENEDMDVDADRNLVFISRDPRGITGIIAPPEARLFGMVHIIDVSTPAAMVQVGQFIVPAGHTSSCVSAGESRCDFLWTGGPYGNEAFGPYGRPIYSTDVRDPLNPVTCAEPINTGLYDGETGYAHDVQVDDQGIAWVSSEGGVHGWWTFGEHLDPTTGEARQANPCQPIPYGGGGTPEEATPSRFMHNSMRPSHAQVPGDDGSLGQVLYATEEDTSTACATSGRFATYDLRSSLGGAGFTEPAEFRLDVLDTWTPEGAEGADGCASAHYFDDRGDGLLAYSFYGQGVRFLDASDPTDIRQVGWYRPDGANAFASYYRQVGDELYVFVADSGRGVDVLRFLGDGGADTPAASMPSLVAPPLPAGQFALPLAMDARFSYLCALTPRLATPLR